MISLFDVSMLAGDCLKERVAELRDLHSQLREWFKSARPGVITYQTKNNKTYAYIRLKINNSWKTKKTTVVTDIAYYTLKCYYSNVYNYLSEILEKHITCEYYYEIRLMIQKFYYDLGNYCNLIVPIDISDEDRAKMWNDEPYDKYDMPVEEKGHVTKNGIEMRSKSEAAIGDHIIDSKHYFKYEPTLKFGKDEIYHPDFAIWDTKRRRVIYWEHFGMMGDPIYSKNVVSKVRVYAKHGIVVGKNFITTFESGETPLGNDIIQLMINIFL